MRHNEPDCASDILMTLKKFAAPCSNVPGSVWDIDDTQCYQEFHYGDDGETVTKVRRGCIAGTLPNCTQSTARRLCVCHNANNCNINGGAGRFSGGSVSASLPAPSSDPKPVVDSGSNAVVDSSIAPATVASSASLADREWIGVIVPLTVLLNRFAMS
ncbi:hypothetical protein RvY_17208 [Ramazzottius varieornatus]|uniref:Uncharacterized protein n=1 Tax=Ramazzottius varieornatus TaxID=947166 RepID=A0A1D1W8I1_RAMVA|nr:hypothetical protein RvY_17208 [Ramazzottius varieornatus]